jgi:hypothetical protein
LIVGLLAGSAHADPMLTPINPGTTYAIDLYDGVTLGNSAVVAMGGATVANAAGSSGTLANPSAPAVRNTTDTDTWSWDYHLDFLDATHSRDFANTGLNGVADHGARMFTGGLSLRVHDWAGAITASTQTVDVGNITLPSGAMAPLAATTLRGRLAIAHWFPSRDIAIGTGFQLASFSIAPDCTTSECKALFTIQGVGLEAGATYIPRWQSWRLGASVSSAIIGGNVVANNCDPNDCYGLVLPTEVRSPWRFAVGGAYRFADSTWNQVVGGNFRDEPAVTVAADLVVTGPTADGYGLDAFAQNQLERSGSNTVLSLRGGAEYEWLPGRLRVRGGSYWEPGRFDGVSGRIHGTFGIEVRMFDFQLWGQRRGRITLTGDVAHRYNNLAISIGFWH